MSCEIWLYLALVGLAIAGNCAATFCATKRIDALVDSVDDCFRFLEETRKEFAEERDAIWGVVANWDDSDDEREDQREERREREDEGEGGTER